MPAQIRGVSRDHDDVSDPGGDFLLAAGAQVSFAGLRAVYAPDIKAEWFPGGGEVGDLLQLLQLERGAYRPVPTSTMPRSRARHGSQATHRQAWPVVTPCPALVWSLSRRRSRTARRPQPGPGPPALARAPLGT